MSVAPRELVDAYLKVIRSAGLEVISFEIQPKAIARAISPVDCTDTQTIVHVMNNKYGIYIVSAGVVCFTSTNEVVGFEDGFIQQELKKVFTYWSEHEPNKEIKKIIFTGKGAELIGRNPRISPDPRVFVDVANVWRNAFSSDDYIPPISFEESLEYVIAAGLALQ